MNGRKKTTLVIVALITIVIFTAMGVSVALYQNTSVSGWSAVGTVLRPVQKFFTNISTSVTDFFTFVSDMGKYKDENEQLKEQVATLEQQNREMQSFKDENTRLRQWLELKDNNQDMDLVLCEVIAKEPGNWFHVFTIDKGTQSGIKKDDVVITPKGLVGRVTETGPYSSKVLSIIDVDSSVGSIVTRTRDIAMVDGDLLLSDQGKCKLNYISKEASVVVGDTIETSGLGGIYPKGLFIGTVSEIKNDSLGFSQYAVIDTAVDFKRVREVAVVRADEITMAQ